MTPAITNLRIKPWLFLIYNHSSKEGLWLYLEARTKHIDKGHIKKT